MSLFVKAALGLGSLVLAAQPASAAIYYLTAKGTIATDMGPTIDVGGIFGTVGANLNGKTFTTVFTIDTSQPWQVSPPAGNTTAVYSSGINPYWSRGNAINASVTIGNKTVSGIGASTNGTQGMTGIGSEQQMAATETYSLNGVPQNYDLISINTGMSGNYPSVSFGVNGVQVTNMRTNIAVGGNGMALVGPNYFPQAFDVATNQFTTNGHFDVGGYNNGQNIGFTAYYRIANVSFIAAPVPEPGTWAMMIGGFGLAGGMLRRKRRGVAALA